MYAFLFALPCVPLIYYGDEIGMPYENIPSKDGGYVRTGSRTPMRWSREENAGFSAAEEKNLYLPLLPCDPSVNAEDEARDPGSLYRCVRELLALRREKPCLGADASFETLNEGYPLIMSRGNGAFFAFINPSVRRYRVCAAVTSLLSSLHAEVRAEEIILDGVSYVWAECGEKPITVEELN